MSDHSDTLIIGAGISGLLAGKILSQAGIDVRIIEKSRGVGGRMATRRFKEGVFDHGAQFFTVREQKFQRWVDVWMREDVVRVWAHSFASLDDNPDRKSYPRYRGVRGMTSVPKFLSAGLDIHLQKRVLSISHKGNFWIAKKEDGEEQSADHLILTAPIPQSIRLLQMGGVSLPGSELDALQSIQYHPCIVLLVLLDGPSRIPAPGGMRFEGGIIQWLGDNSQKGISPQAQAVTIHASADFSRDNFGLDPEHLADPLLSAAKPWIGVNVLDWQLHKWRYSQPAQTYPGDFLEFPGLPGLYLAGDGFGGARVEGAAISGMAAGYHLREKLSQLSGRSPANRA